MCRRRLFRIYEDEEEEIATVSLDKSCPGRRNRGSVPAPLLLIILLLCLLIDPETNLGHDPLQNCRGQGHPTERTRTRSPHHLRKNTTRHRAPITKASPTANETESIRHTPGLPRWPRPAAPRRPRKRRRRHDAAAAGQPRRLRPPQGR